MIYPPILVVGNFIVLNLFLALLLNSFDTEELNAQREVSSEIACTPSMIDFLFLIYVPVERIRGIRKEFEEICSSANAERDREDSKRECIFCEHGHSIIFRLGRN